jgi:hypothetical protein
MTGWSRSGPTGCYEPILAGETVIWMSGVNARGPAYPRCTRLTDPGPGLVASVAERRPIGKDLCYEDVA